MILIILRGTFGGGLRNIKAIIWLSKLGRTYVSLRSLRQGELGFQRIYDMNLALVVKLGCKLAKEHSLWTDLLKSKYLKKRELFYKHQLKEVILTSTKSKRP